MATNPADFLPDGSPGWSSFIQAGSYDGVVFDFVSTQDEIEIVVDRQQMPNRDGVRLERRARGARAFDIMAIVVEDDYPDVMNKLIDKIDNADGPKEFVHPIFGSFKALITRASVSHNADDSIDSATLQLHVEEHTEQTQGPTAVKTSLAARASAARNAVNAALTAATLFGAAIDALDSAVGTISSATQALVDKAIADGTTATTLAGDAADQFEASADEMSLDEIQAQTNGVLTKCDSVAQALSSFTIGDTPMPEQYDYVQSLTALAAAMAQLAEVASSGRPALTKYTIESDTPLLLWVHGKYGDSSRADEVLALNPWISDPLNLPAGAEVTAYAP